MVISGKVHHATVEANLPVKALGTVYHSHMAETKRWPSVLYPKVFCVV